MKRVIKFFRKKQKVWKKRISPNHFLPCSAKILSHLSIPTLFMIVFGLALALSVPEDYQQGITVRILFVHVPFAWLSLFCYTLMAFFALVFLLWRLPIAALLLKGAVPVGTIFTFLALASGSLWGRPMWGTWWEWDARLTSMFILLLLYFGILTIGRSFEETNRSDTATSLLVLVGSINIPIIKFSVEWWNTLHQSASLLRKEKTSIEAPFLFPLLINTLALTSLFFIFLLMATRNEILRRKIASYHWKKQSTLRDSIKR